MQLSDPMLIKPLFAIDWPNNFIVLVQSADFFRDDNPEGIEARNEVRTLYLRNISESWSCNSK
jgi:hypothetical protein